MIIKNLIPSKSFFENRSFWLINVLNIVDVIDREKSQAYYSGDFLNFKTKIYLKDSSYMNGHLLAIIKECEPNIVVHPLLAKYFIKSKGIQFLTDEEAPI